MASLLMIGVMADMCMTAGGLLARITRCPIVQRCLAGEHLPCSGIVGSQNAAAGGFHVPEPWSGHIARAAVLFVSSNPSIDPAEAYPTGGWDDERRADFFAGRFDPRAVPWVDHRMRPLLATTPPTRRDKGTRFWFAARARASELLERQAAAGTDFALTEVVHCKSPGEAGVAEAYDTCVQTWLRPVLRAASAPVIVLFGTHAKRAFHDLSGIEPGTPMTGPYDIEGVFRIVLQLPHPNARSPKVNCHPLTAAQLGEARRHLRQQA